MTFFGQFGGKPDANDVAHLSDGNHSAAEGQDICAVVLTAIPRGGFVVTHRRPNTRNFVCRHAGTDAGAIHHNAEIAGASRHGQSDSLCIIGIIDRSSRICTKIKNLEAEFPDKLFQFLLHFEAAVIGSQGNLPNAFRLRKGRRDRDALQALMAFARSIDGQRSDNGLLVDLDRFAHRQRLQVVFSDEWLADEFDHRAR